MNILDIPIMWERLAQLPASEPQPDPVIRYDRTTELRPCAICASTHACSHREEELLPWYRRMQG